MILALSCSSCYVLRWLTENMVRREPLYSDGRRTATAKRGDSAKGPPAKASVKLRHYPDAFSIGRQSENAL
jgi:hypothetical protein